MDTTIVSLGFVSHKSGKCSYVIAEFNNRYLKTTDLNGDGFVVDSELWHYTEKQRELKQKFADKMLSYF